MTKLRFASGYIIHQHPFQNSSLILHVYTKEFGKIHLLAKGVRKNKNQKSELQPFQRIKINFKHSENLSQLRSIEVLNPSRIDQLLHKSVGLYFNELIYKAIIDNEPSAEFFSYYKNSISSLEKDSSINSCFLRQFELKLLKACGFSIEIDPIWQNDQYLKIDKNLGLSITEFKSQGVCLVSDLKAFLLDKEQNPQNIKKASNLIYQAIDLAVNYKPILARDLIKLAWKK